MFLGLLKKAPVTGIIPPNGHINLLITDEEIK